MFIDVNGMLNIFWSRIVIFWYILLRISQKYSMDLSILQYDVIFLSPDFLRKLRGFSKSLAYVGSVAKGNIG